MNFRKVIFLATVLLALAAQAHAQSQTQTNKTRPLGLEEAIRLALEHNLEVQVEQYNPHIAQYTLSGAYSPYDPVFDLRVERSFFSSPGGFNQQTQTGRLATESYNDSFVPGLSGALPSGLTYNVGGDLYDRTYGSVNTTYQPDVAISLSQPLLKNFWIDATRQSILVNKKNLKISELGLRLLIMDVVNRTEQAYYDLIFSIENVSVQQAGVELAGRLLSENKRRVEVGALAPLDEQQAASQAAVSRADLLTAIGQQEAQENVLKSLITDNYREWHDLTIAPEEKLVAIPEQIDVFESWQKGMTQRPDLLQARLELERSDIILRYDRNQLFPQLDLVGTYGRNGFSGPTSSTNLLGFTNNTPANYGESLGTIRDESFPRYSYGVVFSIPLSNRGPRERYKVSKAQKEQAILQLKQREEGVLIQIDDSVKLVRTRFERVDATRQARLYAESALSAEQKKLENGKSTSFVVLQLQRDLTNARSEEIRALADYNKAVAQLSFNEGDTLERNHLSIDIR